MAHKINACSISDYCNSLLAGLPTYHLDLIQSVFKYAALLIYGGISSDHFTDLRCDNLQWLHVPQWITYKLCLIIYKGLNDNMSEYNSDLRIRVADNKRLRS